MRQIFRRIYFSCFKIFYFRKFFERLYIRNLVGIQAVLVVSAGRQSRKGYVYSAAAIVQIFYYLHFLRSEARKAVEYEGTFSKIILVGGNYFCKQSKLIIAGYVFVAEQPNKFGIDCVYIAELVFECGILRFFAPFLDLSFQTLDLHLQPTDLLRHRIGNMHLIHVVIRRHLSVAAPHHTGRNAHRRGIRRNFV